MTADASYQNKVYLEQCGDKLVVKSGGTVELESGAILTINGVEMSETNLSGVTASAAELNVLDGDVAGTMSAGKPLIPTTGGVVDTLDITTPKFNGGSIGATAAEINNQCDVSAYTQAISSAGAITADGTKRVATIADGSGGYAVTLATPGAAAVGLFLTVVRGSGTHAVTLANTNMTDGSAGTTYTLDAAGEGLLLFAPNTTKWVVVKEFGGVTIA